MMNTQGKTRILIALTAAFALTGAHAQSGQSDQSGKSGQPARQTMSGSAAHGKNADTSSGVAVVTPMVATTPADGYWSDRRYMELASTERANLQSVLQGAGSTEALKKMITDNGFKLTAIIEQSADELEYEVVKGNNSYEVSAELNGQDTPRNIEVSNNIWRADKTERAMNDNTYVPATPVYDPAVAPMYRDRIRMTDWNREQEALKEKLTPGQPVSAYMEQVRELGFQVTSINDLESDYTEFEVVKGSDTFEVQLEKESGSDQVSEVDVTANIWQSDETERALSE